MSDIRQLTLDLVEYFRKISSEDVRALWSIVGRCPADDGDVRENRKAYGCSSRVSPEEPGCGFVIWKTIKGRSISPGEARVLTESGATPFLDGFRTQPSRGRLVISNGQVHLLAEDGARLDAPAATREAIENCPKCGLMSRRMDAHLAAPRGRAPRSRAAAS
jgi:hypothetical protein